jgi:hypothetical protein
MLFRYIASHILVFTNKRQVGKVMCYPVGGAKLVGRREAERRR